MNKVKILQSGDMHFDTPFRELNKNDAEKRKEDLRETFGKIINLAKEEQVKIILITGDLFDNSSVSKATLDYMNKLFNSILNIRIFIAPGNHDPINERSFYKIIKWSENVHIFDSAIEKVVIKELNTAVYGVGFHKKHIESSILKGFKVEEDSLINIMVMHGDVNSSGSSYNPIDENEIKDSNLDYLAVGHKHAYSKIQKIGNTNWAYAGNPEGRGFDEVGDKGIIIGEIGKGFVNLRFHESCKRKYIVENIDITGTSNYEDIIIKINEKLGLHILDDKLNSKMEFNKNNLFKFVLAGKVDKDFYINTSVIYEKLMKEFFYVKIINNANPNLETDSINNEFSFSGVFIRKMKERLIKNENSEESKIIEDALSIGLKCLQMSEVTIDDY